MKLFLQVQSRTSEESICRRVDLRDSGAIEAFAERSSEVFRRSSLLDTQCARSARQPQDQSQKTIGARGAGDSRLNSTFARNARSVARAAGSLFLTIRILGFRFASPQALCCRALRALDSTILFRLKRAGQTHSPGRGDKSIDEGCLRIDTLACRFAVTRRRGRCRDHVGCRGRLVGLTNGWWSDRRCRGDRRSRRMTYG
jgi:hypothetical protein